MRATHCDSPGKDTMKNSVNVFNLPVDAFLIHLQIGWWRKHCLMHRAGITYLTWKQNEMFKRGSPCRCWSDFVGRSASCRASTMEVILTPIALHFFGEDPGCGAVRPRPRCEEWAWANQKLPGILFVGSEMYFCILCVRRSKIHFWTI